MAACSGPAQHKETTGVLEVWTQLTDGIVAHAVILKPYDARVTESKPTPTKFAQQKRGPGSVHIRPRVNLHIDFEGAAEPARLPRLAPVFENLSLDRPKFNFH